MLLHADTALKAQQMGDPMPSATAYAVVRPSRVRIFRISVAFLIAAWALLLAPVAFAQPYEYAQEYFVPVSAESVRAFAQSVNTQNAGSTGGSAPNTVHTVISLTALLTETIAVIDHWEDGPEFDLSNPTNVLDIMAGTGSTEILGDNNANNGAPPGCALDSCDEIDLDTFIVLENDVPVNPRNPAVILYDGQDRIGVTKVMAMTRAGWRLQESTLLAGAVEVYPTYTWGREFELPLGQDQNAGCGPTSSDRIFTTGPDICMFEYTAAAVGASELGATVEIDYNGDGIGDLTQYLGPSESALFSNLLTGSRIITTDPVQVHLLTGDVGSTYEARWFNLVPLPQWADEYYSPVGSASPSQPTHVILYNPGSSAIDVDVSSINSFTPTGSASDTEGADFAITDNACGTPQTATFTALAGLTDPVIDVDLGLRVTGTYRGDLSVVLISPTGTRQEVINNSGDGDNNYDIRLDDTAGLPLDDGDADTVGADGSGTYERLATPSLPLSAFNGETGNGVWSLEICDSAGADLHTFNEAEIFVTTGFATIGTTTVNVPAREIAQFQMPIDSGARFLSQNGDDFFAFSTVDYDNSSSDWGSSLLPAPQLTTSVVAGWAPGRNPASGTNPTQNGSPVWVTAAGPTFIDIDYDGDGIFDVLAMPLGELQSLTIYDPNDQDQNGMVIQSTDGTLITAAWGQDVRTASPGAPAIDVGTTVVPVPVLNLTKDVALLTDVNGDGDPDGGDTLRYTITVVNVGTTPATDVQLEDPVVDPVTAYVLNSTAIDGVALADDGVGTAFPLDEGGINLGTLLTSSQRVITFDVIINSPDAGVLEILNTAIVTSPNGGGVASSVVPVPTPDLAINKTSIVCDGPSPDFNSCSPQVFARAGSGIQYTVVATNTGPTDQIGLKIEDVLPAGTSYVAGSTSVTGFGLDIFRAADKFRTVAYNRQDGPNNWASDWAEINDDGTTNTGNVRVEGGEARIDNQDGGDLEGIERTADLSAFSAVGTSTSATLSFIYRTGSGLEANDGVIVEVIDGGVVCASQQYGDGGIGISPGPSSDYVTLAFDDQGACGEFGTVTVRVRVTNEFLGTGSGGEFFAIDNVQLAVTESQAVTASNDGGGGTQLTDGTPPNLVLTPDLFGLSTLQSLTVVFEVAVDDPLEPFRPSIVNTATVTSLDNPFPVFATVVDPVAEGGAIGDRVWFDVDGDGIDDVGEPGLVNVEVEGFLDAGVLGDDTDDVSLGIIMTDTNGNYLFDNLPPGTYYAVVDDALEGPVGSTIPAGLSLSPGSTNASASRLIVDGEAFLDLDFGYRNADPATAIIGDLIWADGNNNGVREINEPGIGGVTVDLIDLGPDDIPGTPDDFVSQTQTTATDGTYLFIGAAPRSYMVRVTDTANVLDGLALTTGPQSQTNPSVPISVVADDVYLEADFGYFGDAQYTISDTVWIDDNNDQLLNVGLEAGVPSVTVSLVAPGPDMMFGGLDDVIVASAITDANGDFSFTGVSNGDYRIQITDNFNALQGFGPTTTPAGNGYLDLTVAGADVANVSFGYNAAGTIGDTVWSDANGDGIRDPGEAGIGGVDVQLFSDNNADGLLDVGDTQVGATVQTDTFGNYRFIGLEPGEYIVNVPTGQPELAAYEVVTTEPGVPDPATGDQLVSSLGPGESDLTRDFGYQDTDGTLFDISGNVFEDLARDGDLQVGDPGIPGVKLVLLNDSGDMIAMTTTDSNGDYSFPDLPDGETYTVRVVPQQSPVLTDFQLTSGIDTIDITLAGASVTDVDFGYARDTPTGSIGDLVFDDSTNRDGIFNGSESGIPGVTVELWGAGLDGVADTSDDIFVGTEITDADGGYLFSGLSAGVYFVRVCDSYDLGSGNGDATGNPTNACNPVPSPGIGVLNGFERTDLNGLGADSMLIGLAEGADYRDADFGFAVDGGPPDLRGSIGDEVYLDANKDGDRDVGEPGINGVRVDLFRSTDGTVGNADDVYVGSRVTVGGAYNFENLPPGNYFVQVADATSGVGNGGTALEDLERTDVPTSDVSVLIALADNEDFVDADFGYAPGTGEGALGDTVYYDADGSNSQDPGELGLPGVRVIITPDGGVFGCANDSICVETDGLGQYLASVPIGDYQVELCTGVGAPDATCFASNSVPAGLVATQVQPVPPLTVNVPVGGNLDVDFGFDGAGFTTIGDTVYRDIDGNGAQDAVDPGLAGVDVRLINTDTGDVVGTRTTDASGNYLFEGVDPDSNYRVEVVTSTLPPLLYATQSDGVVSASSLTAGVPYETADFGFAGSTGSGPGSIGDTIFLDDNGDGVQLGATEIGIGGVRVRLFDTGADAAIGGAGLNADTQVGADILTLPNGYYEFPNVPDGVYYVQVVDASGTGAGTATTPLEDLQRTPANGSDNNSAVIYLAGGETYVDADFGFDADTSGFGLLGDTVYFDADGSSSQDSGELGLSGVRVIIASTSVVGTPVCGNAGVFCPITDGSGNYLQLVPADSYTVEVCTAAATPNPVCTTPESVPALMNVVTETPSPGIRVVTDGSTDLGADFGFDEVGDNFITIGNTIYRDRNGNQQQDLLDPLETGIAGVTVALQDISNPSSPVVLGLAETDVNGNYSFQGVPVFTGTTMDDPIYRVVVTDQAQVVQGLTLTQPGRPMGATPAAGVGEILDSEVDAAGTDYQDADFGYTTLQELGDTVFVDAINSETPSTGTDGFQQDSELGIPGVRVIVTPLGTGAPDCSGASICTTTDAQGRWRVIVPSGSYSVLVCTDGAVSDCVAANSIPATLNQTTTSFAGSGGNPQVFEVTSGSSVLFADFGFEEDSATYATIGDTVYVDTNGDGDQDPGEVGAVDVTVTLFVGTTQIGTATTDSSGNYRFYGVDPTQTYTVVVTDEMNILDRLIPTQIGDPADGGDGTVLATSLSAGTDYNTADFGYSPSVGAIGDRVWRDLADGSIPGFNDDFMPIVGYYEDGEPGIEGVTLELWVDNNTNGVIEPGTDNLVRDRESGGLTNSIGQYFFTGLTRNVSYLVRLTDEFDATAGLTLTSCTDDPPCAVAPRRGTVNGVDNQSKESPYAVTLTTTPPLSEDFTADFGYMAAPGTGRTLFGQLFADNDNNGNYSGPGDMGPDVGIAGVQVRLFRIYPGLPFKFLFATTTTTDTMNNALLNNGEDYNYLFTGLPEATMADLGTWLVEVDNTGTFLSGAAQTEPVTGPSQPAAQRETTILASNAGDMTPGVGGREVDFGFFRPPTLVVITDTRSVLDGGEVAFEFETVSQIGTVGFFLWRFDDETGSWVQVNDSMVVADPSPLGATYRIADPGAEPGMHEYMIYEVETRGGEQIYGPVVVTTEVNDGIVGAREFQTVREHYSSSPREQSVADRERFAAARAEAELVTSVQQSSTGLVSVSSGASAQRRTSAQIKVTEGGMQRLTSAAMAAATGYDQLLVETWIASGDWRLLRGERLVSWHAAADNASLVFYAPKPSSRFSDFAAYQLNRGPGSVMETRDGGASPVAPSSAFDVDHLESQALAAVGLVYEGDRDFWFWKQLLSGSAIDRTEVYFDLATVKSPNGTIDIQLFGLTGSGAGVDHRIEVSLNAADPLNPTAGELLCAEGSCEFTFSGSGDHRLTAVTNDLIAGTNTLSIKSLVPQPAVSGSLSSMLVDWVKVGRTAALDAVAGSLAFTASAAPDSTVSGFGEGDPISVYELGATTRRVINVTRSGDSVAFATTEGRRYLAAGDTTFALPTAEPWLTSTSFDQGAEYVVIAPANMRGPAQDLANYRSADYSTLVIDVETIFNEYAFGDRDPAALKAFLADAWANWSERPRFVTLFGKGSYDYLDVLGHGGNNMPALLKQTEAGLFSSDASLGNVAGDAAPEFAIGRIPAVTNAEAEIYLRKLMDYEGLPTRTVTPANSDVVLVADDSDLAGNFFDTSNRLSRWVSQQRKTRLTLGPMSTGDLRSDLLDTINDGAYWINYSGHGGPDRMAHEGLLTTADVAGLATGQRLPIVTGLSCTIGRFEFPGFTSLSELLVLAEDKGAIAVWAPSGVSYDLAAAELGEDLFRRVFGFDSAATLGEAILETSKAHRQTSPQSDLTEIYNLIGDPALKLLLP